jgi:hypothetical protein
VPRSERDAVGCIGVGIMVATFFALAFLLAYLIFVR